MTSMKRLFLGLLAGGLVGLALMAASPIAYAQDEEDDRSWWGRSGAKAYPVQDSTRSRHWWWPKEPASNEDDQELWGNRGIIYSLYTPEFPSIPPAPEEPVNKRSDSPESQVASVEVEPEPVAPEPTRSTPIFTNVLFDFDKSVLRASGKSEIDKVIANLNENTGDTLTIEGHTDDINRSGDPEYNQKLGQRRADAARAYIVGEGIDEGRVTAVSEGDREPALSNTSDESRGMNRRAVFVYAIRD